MRGVDAVVATPAEDDDGDADAAGALVAAGGVPVDAARLTGKGKVSERSVRQCHSRSAAHGKKESSGRATGEPIGESAARCAPRLHPPSRGRRWGVVGRGRSECLYWIVEGAECL